MLTNINYYCLNIKQYYVFVPKKNNLLNKSGYKVTFRIFN